MRDALNFALLQLQRYFRMLHSRSHQQQHNENILTQTLRGLSPMTPFRDAPDQFMWHWLDVDANSNGHSVRSSKTLPTRLADEMVSVPAVIQVARSGDNHSLVQLIERGMVLQSLVSCIIIMIIITDILPSLQNSIH